MTLPQKAICMVGSTVAGVAMLTVAMLWSLGELRQDLYRTYCEYRELRLINQAEFSVSSVVPLLSSDQIDYKSTAERLRTVAAQLQAFLSFQQEERLMHVDPLHEGLEIQRASSVATAVNALVERLSAARGLADSPSQESRIKAELAGVHQGLDHLRRVIDSATEASRNTADDRLRSAVGVAVALCLAIIGMTTLVSVWQYRGIMRPLRELREGVRRISSGSFSARLAVVGDAEFAELTGEFNRMASELDDLYRNLESKVTAHSKQLVRSERLASVGFLAAGVAHEINTPLNVISTHAELELKRLFDSARENNELSDTQKTLQIIRDEAFRCGTITGKLLSLARSGNASRSIVSLPDVVDEVVSMTAHLARYRDRQMEVKIDRSRPHTVQGSEQELKQVLLNLTVNALEAVDPGTGEVTIEGDRQNGWVELSIVDNGHGMTPETIEHVFEPFYTNRRGSSRPGTGLGLSITHAIVEAHHGQIEAESEGPGKGARFSVRFPFARKQETDALQEIDVEQAAQDLGRNSTVGS